MYLFLAVLGLRCCAEAFSSCCVQALGTRASVVVALEHRLSSCGSRA